MTTNHDDQIDIKRTLAKVTTELSDGRALAIARAEAKPVWPARLYPWHLPHPNRLRERPQ